MTLKVGSKVSYKMVDQYSEAVYEGTGTVTKIGPDPMWPYEVTLDKEVACRCGIPECSFIFASGLFDQGELTEIP